MAWTDGNIYTGAADIVKIDGVDVGATSGGIEFKPNPTWLDCEIDQEAFPVKTEQVYNTMEIDMTLAEGTLQNWMLAWSIPSANLISSSLNVVGASGRQAVTCYIETPTVEDTTNDLRIYDFQNCVARGDGSIKLAHKEWNLVPMKLFVLVQDSTTGKLGTIYDKAAA